MRITDGLIIVILAATVNSEWGAWSSCSKSCDYGTQQRQWNLTTSETQYCNTQFCTADIVRSCNASSQCSVFNYQCINNTCHCKLQDDYNPYNCYPQIGNCFIQYNAPGKLGYTDSSYPTYSCITNDNVNYEVHFIGIYGASSSSSNRNYEITIKSRGQASKPIILILTSYESTFWTINTTVGLFKVLYGGYKKYDIVVEEKLGSKCYFSAERKYDKYGYGSDTGGGSTQTLLEQVFDEFGPITSFTGFYHINTSPVAKVTLEVGGNPLQHLPSNYSYNEFQSDCASERNVTVNCPSDISYSAPYPWSSWSQCSKSCDVGITSRCRYNHTEGRLEAEDEYCNLQYCPDNWKSCSNASNAWTECYSVTGSRSKCENNRCICTLGDGYNQYNCFPSVGNCILREEPDTALGYKDLSYRYPYSYPLYSCTTNDNTNYELHVVGIYGDEFQNIYQVSLVPRGPVSKPIILVLSSYHTTHWKINSPVGIYKVVLSGMSSYFGSSTVTKASPSTCDFVLIRNSTFRYGHGKDTGGGSTLQYITNVYNTFGPLTSFTGYYELSTSPISHIIIRVGGSPLQVLHGDRLYDVPLYTCSNNTQHSIPFTTTITDDTTTQQVTAGDTLTKKVTGTNFYSATTSTADKTTTKSLTTTFYEATDIVLEYVIVLVLESGLDMMTDVSVLNDKNSAEYKDIYIGLLNFWVSALGQSLKEMEISTISRTSSLILNLRILLSSDNTGDLLLASSKLVNKLAAIIIQGTSIGGQTITITNALNGHSVFMSVTSTDNACNQLTTLSPCGVNEECAVTGNKPVCIESNNESGNNKTTVIIIVAVACVLIVVVVIVLVVMKKRNQQQMTGTNSGNTQNTQNSDRHGNSETNPNEVYDEIPAYDPPSYESLQRSSEHNYEMLGKQQMGSNYMDVIA